LTGRRQEDRQPSIGLSVLSQGANVGLEACRRARAVPGPGPCPGNRSVTLAVISHLPSSVVYVVIDVAVDGCWSLSSDFSHHVWPHVAQ
jgi:hypothetical protein